jgi:glycopeptide antibiotics resistance protein
MVRVSRKIRMVALSAFGISFSIEVIQLVFKMGLFEFDDMFHNVLGAVIGYGLWKVRRKFRM